MESGPVAVEPVEDAVLDEQYLRSLHIDHLTALLDKYGVVIPDPVDCTSTTEIVDYVVETYGA